LLRWEKFLLWLLPKTGKVPRSVRLTFQQRIDNAALEVLEGLLAARCCCDRTGFLREVFLGTDKLQVLPWIAHQLGYHPARREWQVLFRSIECTFAWLLPPEMQIRG